MASKEELKVDAQVVQDKELGGEIDQSGWNFKYEWDQSKSSYVTPKGQLLSEAENFKTPEIKLMSFERPHMRGFHYAWVSFFLAFLCWFSFAPLMPLVREDLNLAPEDVLTTTIASVFSTVFARFIMGPLCEQWGPKRCQFLLLMWTSVMVFLAPTVSNLATLAIIRCLIGFGGASFVVTQYWSSMLFTKDIVGLANATTGGWGNLGGGVTQNVMPALWKMWVSFGYSSEQAWRLSFLIPATVVALFAITMRLTSDDSPQGDYVPLMKAGTIEKRTANQSFKGGFWNPNNWLLGVQYAACFGVELHMNNTAAMYFKDNFAVSPYVAGNLASVFGWMNLCCRSVGGGISDYGMKTLGMQGRLLAQTLCLIFEAVMLITFSRQTSLPVAMVVLAIFSGSVQAAEGMTFGIVPYVDPKNTGAVCAVVGAWGNIGAVCWGFLFRQAYATNFADGYLTMGFIVMATAPLCAVMKIHGHTSLFSSEPYGGYCTEEYIQKQTERIATLEERTAALEAKTAKHETELTQREA